MRTKIKSINEYENEQFINRFLAIIFFIIAIGCILFAFLLTKDYIYKWGLSIYSIGTLSTSLIFFLNRGENK